MKICLGWVLLTIFAFFGWLIYSMFSRLHDYDDQDWEQ